MTSVDEIKEFFSDLFECSREIEFTYQDKQYSIEPDPNEENKFNIWMLPVGQTAGGMIIGEARNLDEVINSRFFDNSSLYEIYDKTTDFTYF